MQPLADAAEVTLTLSADTVGRLRAGRSPAAAPDPAEPAVQRHQVQPPGGHVWLAWHAGDGQMALGVRDDGPGIDPAVRSRLFTPFDRLGAEASGIDGTGIGLALTRSLTEMMGGSIAVDSALGRGIDVHCDAEEHPGAPARASGRPRAPAPTPRGDPESRRPRCSTSRTTRRTCASSSICCACVRTGGWCTPPSVRSGIELAEAHQPDLILLDLHLPDLSRTPGAAKRSARVRRRGIRPSSCSRPTRRRAWRTGFATRAPPAISPSRSTSTRSWTTSMTVTAAKPRSTGPMTGQLAIYNGMSVLDRRRQAEQRRPHGRAAARAGHAPGPHRDRRPAGAATAGRARSRSGAARSAHALRRRPHRAHPDPALRRGQLPARPGPHRRHHDRGPRSRARPGRAGLSDQARRRRRGHAAHRQPAADPATAGSAAPDRRACAARARAALDGPRRTPRAHRCRPARPQHHAASFSPWSTSTPCTIVGYEGLSRFPDRGALGPQQWFSDAFEVGLGPELEWLAATSILGHLDALPADAFLAINMSPATILYAIERELCPPDACSRVVIELTEHVPIEDYSVVQRALATVRSFGARLAADDLGSGYAGFRHLVSLRPDLIKLDMSLVRGIHDNPGQRALASALVAFAKDVGARVIAEGVEEQAELDTLRCHRGALGARVPPRPAGTAPPRRRRRLRRRVDARGLLG